MSSQEAGTHIPVWRRLITPLLIAALLAAAVALLPRGFDTDLSQIGRGEYAVVQVFKQDTLRNQKLMDALNDVRDQYETRGVKFLLADIDTQAGQQFAQSHGVGSATVLLFGPRGEKLQTLRNVQDSAALQRALSRALPQ